MSFTEKILKQFSDNPLIALLLGGIFVVVLATSFFIGLVSWRMYEKQKASNRMQLNERLDAMHERWKEDMRHKYPGESWYEVDPDVD